MGRYYRENYTENVQIDGFELPCECFVEVSGGGKHVYTHNGIKEITGIKNRRVRITGRLEAGSYDELLRQVKAIMSLSAKTDALDITSVTADSYGIKQIIMEDDPKISLISGFDNSRNLSIEAEEEAGEDIVLELLGDARKLQEEIMPVVKEVFQSVYTVKAGDSLSKIALKEYGDFSLWKSIYGVNRELIGSNPNSMLKGIGITIPSLASKDIELSVQIGDSYASLSNKYFYHSGYKDIIKKVNDGKDLVVGELIKIPSLLNVKKMKAVRDFFN